MKYEIIESDIDNGLYIIKMEDGLLLSLYNIAITNEKMYYKYDILNSNSNTDFSLINKKIKKIIEDICFNGDI